MLKRIALLCLALLLMLPCAFAEDAPEENPFIGAWEVLYYIQDGKACTPEETGNVHMMKIMEEGIYSYAVDNEESPLFTYTLGDGFLVTHGIRLVLQGDDLIVGTYEGGSVLLTRIDPLVLNNPFIGTWIPVCTVQGEYIEVMPEWTEEAAAVFSANTAQLIDGDATEIYPCTYADGTCIFPIDDEEIVCAIAEDGLLRMTYANEYQIICARKDEDVPEEISQFYGAWREIAALNNGSLTTDQDSPALQLENGIVLSQLDFTRAAVLSSYPEMVDFPSFWTLCTYHDSTCTLHFVDTPFYCTIDENGLMCMRSEDGSWTSWLVRVEEENAEDPLAAE